MKKEVNGVVGIIIVLLVAIILVLASILLFKNNNNTNDVQKENESTEKEYSKIENIDTIAKNFYDKYIPSMMRLNNKVYFNGGRKINFNDISLDERMSIVYNLTKQSWAVNNLGDKEIKTISASDFKNYYVQLFGSSNYKDKSFLNEFWWFKNPLAVEYDKDNNQYRAIIISDGIGMSGYTENYYYNKSVQFEDKIEIYVNVAYIKVKDGYNGNLYSDYSLTNLIAEVTRDSDLSSYMDKLGLQKYTLVKDNNNYVLESIEIVK